MPTDSRQWYALVVRSNHAFKLRDRLQELGIDEFLPTFTETIQWSDRIKTTERQLFPGYLFAKLNGDSNQVLNLPGVIQLLPSNLNPISIDDAEIESLRIVTASQLPVVRVPYTPGTKVSVVSGPLKGASGIVKEACGAVQVTIGIEMLGRAVSVMVDAGDLEKAIDPDLSRDAFVDGKRLFSPRPTVLRGTASRIIPAARGENQPLPLDQSTPRQIL